VKGKHQRRSELRWQEPAASASPLGFSVVFVLSAAQS